VKDFHRGNVPTKEGREHQSQIIDAGHVGGSTEDMQRLNAARDDLKSDLRRKTVVIDWWKQEFNDIAAQMAKNMTIKTISALCAVAIDLKKSAAAAKAESQSAQKGQVP
jgi:hypothetical protein